MTVTDTQAGALRAMDDPSNVAELSRVGALAAARQVSDEHFPRGFDRWW
jgi:hypothetical protein